MTVAEIAMPIMLREDDFPQSGLTIHQGSATSELPSSFFYLSTDKHSERVLQTFQGMAGIPTQASKYHTWKPCRGNLLTSDF